MGSAELILLLARSDVFAPASPTVSFILTIHSSGRMPLLLLSAEFNPPPGWRCARMEADELVFVSDGGRFTVIVEQAAAIQDSCGLDHGWKITCHQRYGECTSKTLVNRVATREAARESEQTCMETINRALRDARESRWLPLSTLLHETDLES